MKNRKSVDSKVLIRMLLDDGWVFKYQKGSHRFFKHPVKRGKISVPYQCSKNIEISVMRQAGIGRYANRPNCGQKRVEGMPET